MSRLRLVPRIHMRNQLLLPAGLFNVTVPRGLDDFYVRAPLYVSVTEMQQLLRSASRSTTLNITGGLVTADVSVAFANPDGAWHPVQNRSQPHFQFRGGEVRLVLTLGIHLLEHYREPEERFSVIMSHELLHVLDEIQIVRGWLPTRVLAEPIVRRYLVRQEPILDRTLNHYFRGNGFRNLVHALWAGEHNRRERLRDSPTEYRRLQDQLDEIQRSGVNRREREQRGRTQSGVSR